MMKENRTTYSSWLATLMLLVNLIFITSCKEEDPAPTKEKTIGNEVNTHVNTWILKNMKYWYLWNDKIPAGENKDQDPETYFKSLLVSEDRFSWIQNNYQELLNSLQGISKEAGYEFALYRENATGNTVIAQILYIKTGSPADIAGLKRGDVITHINDQKITTDNYKTLLASIKENHIIRYKPLIIDEEKFDTEKTASLITVEFKENPNYLNKVLEVNGRKIGYFVYNFFAGGDNKKYDTEMDAIFDNFKSLGITDLVLDLRFNSGGSETSANNLASLIGKGVNSNKVFLTRGYNAEVKETILNDPTLGQDFLTSKFLNKSGNIGSLLNGNRVYILTSSRTASASELIINALRPYMDVFLIGDVTYGKNVGSISLYDEKDPKNTWGLQPIVLKVFNSLGQSDYGNGFTPQVIDKDNSLYLYPLGDARENLLQKAIGQITGTSALGREREKRELKQLVGHSLDFHRRSFNLVMDEYKLKQE